MKLECNIIKDLAGVYTDGAASEETSAEVSAHLAECPECRKFYKIYKDADQTVPTQPDERQKQNFQYDEKYLSLSNLLKRKKKIKNSSLAVLGLMMGASITFNIILLKKILNK